MVSYLVHVNSLLQNATDIIAKWDRYFITKCDKSLLQNALVFLLQNTTVLLQMRRFLNQIVKIKNLAQSDCKKRISLNMLKPNKKN